MFEFVCSVCVCVCVHVHACMHACMHSCVRVCMCVCVSVCWFLLCSGLPNGPTSTKWLPAWNGHTASDSGKTKSALHFATVQVN